MRLIRLKIKNIASLWGEHVVDFESIQTQSSLFAITGETGAGKSSILNAIGLALYGEIYKKNVTQTDVVTLGEKEGEIELIFQVSGKYYLADWKAKVRKQNGELLKQPLIQRQVYPIASGEFDSFRSEPIESIERLLNLDFEQFCKCIILNQGEFARFLSSSFTERKEILEKLYPGELLDNLGKELRTQLDAFEREKSDLDIKLGELRGEPLSGENLKEQKLKLKHDLDLFENWFKKIESLEFHFVSLFSSYTKFHDNKKKADLIRLDMARATTAFNEVLKDSQLINETYQKARAREEKEMPRLRELLKIEEALKLVRETHQLTEKKLQGIEIQANLIDKNLVSQESKVQDWKKSYETILAGFKYNVEHLKTQKDRLERIFDLYADLNFQRKEQISMEEKLKELETHGKEINSQYSALTLKMADSLPDLADRLATLEQKKLEIVKANELRQRTELKIQDLKKKIDQECRDGLLIEAKLKESNSTLIIYEQEALALENTIRLQELTSAIETCLTHAETKKVDTCPVCTSSILPTQWGELMGNLKKADINLVKHRFTELSRLIIQLQEESKHASLQLKSIEDSKKQNLVELDQAETLMKEVFPSLSDIEEEIKALQKKSWEQETLKAEDIRLKNELAKARENYLKAKNRNIELLQIQTLSEKKIEEEVQKSQGLLKLPLSTENIETLKENNRLLTQLLQSEAEGDKLKQEQSFLQKNKVTLLKDKDVLIQEHAQEQTRIQELNLTLKAELQDKGVQELIESINREVKEWSEKWAKSEKELKQHELTLKDFQSRLYTLDEQLKEYDLLFVREKHSLRESAQENLPQIKEDLTALMMRLQTLSLDFASPPELYIPLKEILTSEKDALRSESNTIREAHASVNQRLLDWEKRLDKIQVLELTRSDIELKLNRLKRLFDVLGKDELRSFVLSLVEENLIIQTNEELQKLCQGRYEIIHQSKGLRMTPEFYILDKFREGGRRKVSTLSGGETFMVSLAMALGLAEMTRGKAEIDSLFIDEGFGTLDQDSLEDVLDMLNQIQTRGLMVGIISHIKTLTNAIPVNLLLMKKQDGTSSINIQVN